MKTLIGWTLIGFAVVYGLSGCVPRRGVNVRVLGSKEVIKEQLFTLHEGDTVVCDPRGCRTVER